MQNRQDHKDDHAKGEAVFEVTREHFESVSPNQNGLGQVIPMQPSHTEFIVDVFHYGIEITYDSL
jgi:hypothetical protein